jgi:hypothetical protein
VGNALSASVTGLTNGVGYTLYVHALDAAGNASNANGNSFTTLDTSAPGAPGTPSFSSITGSSATASWTAASDNVGVTSYEWSINGGSRRKKVVRALTSHYGDDCPAVVAYRVSWPDELLLRGTLATIRGAAKAAGITRTALILVGPALAGGGSDSRLYAADHHHMMRPRR